MTHTYAGTSLNSAQAGAQHLARGPVDLLGEDLNTLAGEILDLMRWPMGEDLLAPIAAAAAAEDAAEYSGPTRARGKKRVSVYGPPTDKQIEPDRYVPRPSIRRMGKGLGVPEAQRKRTCIDLSVQLTDEEDHEVEHNGYIWSVTYGLYMPKWLWNANYVAIPNNGWAEVMEVY